MTRLAYVAPFILLLAGCNSGSDSSVSSGTETGSTSAVAIIDEAGPIQVDEYGVPVIRVGLWQVAERNVDGEVSRYRECMPAWHEASREKFELARGCSKVQARTDKRLTVTETCQMGDSALTSVHTYTGSDTTFIIGTENKAGILSTDSRIEARWEGPCPADMGRGDVLPLNE